MPTRINSAFGSQDSQLLRERRLANVERFFQLAHAHLALRQLAKQEQAILIGKHFQCRDSLHRRAAKSVRIDTSLGSGHGNDAFIIDYSLCIHIMFVNILIGMTYERSHRDPLLF